MLELKSIYADKVTPHRRRITVALFLVWFGLVTFFAWTHLVWRDEVRALSLALQGDTVAAMLKGIHGEGHPAVWYLLLRTAHFLLPRPEVLQLVALVVATAAMLILCLRSPFSLPFLALLLINRFSIYEYSVMARNYGISMLCIFLFAVFYERHRKKDCWLGVLLFLLVNCNVPSAMFAGGLLLFWFVDILCDQTADRRKEIRIFFYNAAVVAIGIVICFITVFPTFNDAATTEGKSLTFSTVMKGLFLPSLQFVESSNLPGEESSTGIMSMLFWPLAIVKSLILFGSTLGLVRRPGAFLAALTTLVGYSLFSVLVYSGGYRQQALWLVFVICMYWLSAPGNAGNWCMIPARLKPVVGWLSTAGTGLFVLLMLLRAPYGARRILDVVTAPSATLAHRRDNFGTVLAEHPELKQAVVIADPDFLVETIRYYVSNPTYLVREQRYGDVVHFTHNAKFDLSLGDLLSNARRLQQETGRAVVIFLAHNLDSSSVAHTYEGGYGWKFTITPEEAREFREATRFLEHHNAPAGTDEGYEVYVLGK